MVGPFQIAGKTIRFYRNNFWDCLIFGLLSQIVSIIGMALSPLKTLSDMTSLSEEWLLDNMGQAMTMGVVWIVWAVLNLWLYLLIAGAVSKLVWKRSRNEEAQAFSSYLQTFEEGGPLLWANLMTTFVIGGAILLTFILFFLQSKIGEAQVLFSLLLLAAMAGTVFLCLKFSLITPVVLLERSRGYDALKRSWRLMTGHEGSAFTLFVLFFTVLILLGVLTGYLQGGDVDTLSASEFPPGQVLEHIVGIVVAPLFPIGVTQFYQEIIKCKELVTPS